MNMSVLPLVYMYTTCMLGVCIDKIRELNPLELKKVVSYHVGAKN